jgi:hypothetical protein
MPIMSAQKGHLQQARRRVDANFKRNRLYMGSELSILIDPYKSVRVNPGVWKTSVMEVINEREWVWEWELEDDSKKSDYKCSVEEFGESFGNWLRSYRFVWVNWKGNLGAEWEKLAWMDFFLWDSFTAELMLSSRRWWITGWVNKGYGE